MTISGVTYSPGANLVTKTVTEQASAAPSATSSFFGEIWDTINPLQHIPVVSSIYRSLTGEGISTGANIAGSTLYGGPIGGAIAVASEIGNAIFGTSKPASQTALAETAKAPAKNPYETANNTVTKMRVTTQDWLNPNFGKQPTSITA